MAYHRAKHAVSKMGLRFAGIYWLETFGDRLTPVPPQKMVLVGCSSLGGLLFPVRSSLIFPPTIYIQHNQCPCRCLLRINRETSSVVTNYEIEMRIATASSKVTWPRTANRSGHEGKIYAGQDTGLFARKARKENKEEKEDKKKLPGTPCWKKKEGNRTARERRKRSQTDSQQLFYVYTSTTKQMTPGPGQRRRQQPYWVPNDPIAVGAGALPHGLSPAHTVSDDNSCAHAVIVAPVPNTKTRLNNKARKNTATEQLTPPSRCRGSTQTGFRMQLLIVEG